MSRGQAYAYLVAWGTVCVIAAGLLFWNRQRNGLCSRSYWHYLSRPWKLVTFLVAATGLTLIAPYTGDPTWDYIDAAFMSALAFSTAPWVVGTFFRAFRRRSDGPHVFIGAAVWLFSASWSYDLYLLLRDGYYPVTWWANLVASSVLYLAAGLFWNLDWDAERGWTFGFTEEGWPRSQSGASFRRVLLPALLFMALISVVTLLFAWPSGK
jgi:hypothetical protein